MDDTDEDFFDKLVDDVDDHCQTTASSSTNAAELPIVNYSNEAKSSANSSITDGKNTLTGTGKVGISDKEELTDNLADPDQTFDNVNEQPSNAIKEVQWSAFTSDSLDNSGKGFGSYSDFFTEFGDNLVNKTANSKGINDYLHQFQEGQDLNNSQYWENRYPGWKYDANTGQWYQLNEGYDAKSNTGVTYFQQTGQSDKSTNESVMSWSPVSQTSYTNESLSNWSQSSQGNYGYPSHMYFDPQYPGWYYDMNVQEWCTLDAYNQQQSYDYGGTASSFYKSSQIYNEFPSVSGSQSIFQQSGNQNSYASSAGRSSVGQPSHALVTFGFGGKLIVMKDTTALINASYGGLDSNVRSISILNLAEIVIGGADVSSVRGYIHTLCRQSFPGPLAGGNVGIKELNKWIDERITHPADVDYRKDEVVRLLLSLLKIASQHYGKLRSPFGTDTTSKENDAPDVAVARLFASAKKNNAQYGDYGAFARCLQQSPSEGQTRATAAEVQNLLVFGRKIEALHRALEGQLWGLALVLAAQLGDQLYVDTVRNMALRQLVAGSPLRTLCLLIAGQPADVFSTDTTTDSGISGVVNMFQQPAQAQLGANAMLNDWEENLAMITANRTKDDELVLIHLGDCLWKETSNIVAAHICYLVAEANFEPYSDSARLCLIGADHWKHPRTYACPEAIQRTEVYEYSMLLGNSQFTLLPFQPYKLIYANMLAEVGRLSDSLKYCQVISKSLKPVRAPEVDTWRHMVSSLEDRIKTRQQSGLSTNLAPGKLVGTLLNFFDSTAHRVVGELPPPVPSTSASGAQNVHFHPPMGHRVSSSQSTMTMSSLVPSASMEPDNRRILHNRSISEPDFGRSPRQVKSSKENYADSQSKASSTSRFRRFGFGSQLFQKTVGLVLKPRQDKQAKLGETNKFYYDEKLKRWVEEGVDPPSEEAALPPPPKMAAFQNGTSEGPTFSNGSSKFSSGTSVGHSSGIPPIPATSSQFLARGRTGVRARYVDTFNQGGGNPTKLFQSPSSSSIKPVTKSNPKFFIPAADQPAGSFPEKTERTTVVENHSSTSVQNSFQSPSYQSSIQRFASMDDIGSSISPRSRRTFSWGGSTDERFSASSSEKKPNESFAPSEPAVAQTSNGDGFTDDLHEVEL